MIFVLDASSRDRIAESKMELAKLLSEKELKDATLLILANKQVYLLTYLILDRSVLGRNDS